MSASDRRMQGLFARLVRAFPGDPDVSSLVGDTRVLDLRIQRGYFIGAAPTRSEPHQGASMSDDDVLSAVGSNAEVIVVIGHGESGESASTNAEWSSTYVVFKKAGSFSRATARRTHDMYRSRTRHFLEDEKPI